jgi:hypothetical protein
MQKQWRFELKIVGFRQTSARQAGVYSIEKDRSMPWRTDPVPRVVSVRRCGGGMQAQPLVRDLSHVLGLAIVDPRHEWPVEPERRPALSGHEAPHVLRIPIMLIHRRIARNEIGVPIESHV